MVLPFPIKADWIEIHPLPGFGRRAINFQFELFGNYIDLGFKLGLEDGSIPDQNILVSESLHKTYPRLNGCIPIRLD